MNPKNKAKELINKFIEPTIKLNPINGIEYYHDIIGARICALIAVDEILNMPKIASFRRDEVYMELEYWIEVKNEIEKI